MKKYLVLVMVMFFALLVGCSDSNGKNTASASKGKQETGISEKELTGKDEKKVVKEPSENGNIFDFSQEEIALAQTFIGKFSKGRVSLNYPSDWQKPSTKDPELELEIQQEGKSVNMNVIMQHSDKYFFKTSPEVFKNQYPPILKEQGFSKIKMIKVEKNDWQNGKGMYAEYYGTMEGILLHLVQYIYDDGKDLVIFTFACTESEWDECKDTIRGIMASAVIK